MKNSLMRQIRTMIPVLLYSFLNAVHYPWTTANLEYFRSTTDGLSFSDTEISLLTSLFHFGRLIAAITEVFPPIKYGRKTHFIISAVLMLVGTLILLFFKTVQALSVARIAIGFGVALGDMSMYMYVGETVAKEIRGVFISVTIIVFSIGIMSTFAAPIYFVHDHILIAVLSLNVLLFLSAFDLVESPYFLVMNGRLEEAKKNLKWLNDYPAERAEEELKTISDNVDKLMNVFDLIGNFRRPEIYKSCCIVISLGVIFTILQTITTCFANVVFPKTDSISSNEFAIGFTALILLATCGSSLVVDRCGRRILLLAGLLLQTILQASIAVLYCLEDGGYVALPNFPWLIFGVITVTFWLFQFGCLVPYGVVRGEIFPTNFKSIAVGANVIFNSLSNAIFSYLFLPLQAAYGIYLSFLIFSVLSAAGLLLVSVLLPETKGKSLIEIQLMLRKKS